MKNRKNLRLIGILCLNFAVLFAIYKLILICAERFNYLIYYIGMSLYLAAAAVLFCVYYAKNSFSLSGKQTKAEDLPEEWTHIQKTEYLNLEAKKKAGAKKILLVLLPMILTIMINYIDLIVIDAIKNLFIK